MMGTAYSTLIEDRQSPALNGNKLVLALVVGAACTAIATFAGQHANLISQPATSAVLSRIAPSMVSENQMLRSRASEEIRYTTVAAETPGVPLQVQSLAFGAPHLLIILGLPLAALGTFLVAFRKVSQPAPFNAISIAPATGYKVVRSSTALRATPIGGAGERYEVELEKPIGITLARGNDGATYVAKVPPGPRYTAFTIGDRVTKCSASFGPDIWEALNYGQVMFAIKTRNGNVFLELEKRDGDMSVFENKKSSRFASERNSGNYGAGTAELQMQKYAEMKELEKKREAMLREAEDMVGKKQYEDALVTFENIIGMEPNKYISDNFALSTDIFRISHYQMACVYSLMGNVDASLESLREAMNAGYDNFKEVRSDPDLARVRDTEEFEELMGRYDESLFNADAINALKGMFGGLFKGK